LSESAAFAAQVAEAGLTFIGPPAEVIANLGDKITARRLLSDAGVPIVPGMVALAEDPAALAEDPAALAEDPAALAEDPAALAEAAEEIGFPVLIKATAGGGGKGMRIAQTADALAETALAASSEAKNAFGDGSIYLERYLDRPRHVEVQILADGQGHAIHLCERECSIQRRHQKIIEETPSPALDADLRARMGEAAVAAAKAVGYVNAGTVEFLLDSGGDFYFLEVNTRLQVEHPITEVTVGLDLVRHQVEIAAGAALSIAQSDVSARGHAIECRIYAEDPAADFMPSPGTILYCRPAAGPGVRFDSGIYTGAEVPVHYDPILGKVIVWAEDRPAAIARMIRALQDNVVLGVHTATELMIDILGSAPFGAGDTHTRFIEDHFADWRPSADGDAQARLGYVAADLTGAGHSAVGVGAGGIAGAAEGGPGAAAWPSPWQTLGQWTLRS